ncbi:MAG: hypothetical protein V1798_04075 [Pseudomonadota bacterium]
MNHIAMDLGGRNSQLCVRNGQGEVLQEERIERRSLGRYLQKAERGRVVMETRAESLAVAENGYRLRRIDIGLEDSLARFKAKFLVPSFFRTGR